MMEVYFIPEINFPFDQTLCNYYANDVKVFQFVSITAIRLQKVTILASWKDT